LSEVASLTQCLLHANKKRTTDCDEGLICYNRKKFEQVPFCNGDGVHFKDYCTFPFKEKEYEGVDERGTDFRMLRSRAQQ